MRKGTALALAMILLLAGWALADETVRLPESRYTVVLPEGMAYDGPTPDTREAFAFVNEEIGLEISFLRFCGEEAGLADVLVEVLAKGAEDIQMTAVNGIEMMAFRFPPEEENGMKSIGYILQDGDATQLILFRYATQEAAGLTKTIMESIGETETV